jgi:hypothetical protein
MLTKSPTIVADIAKTLVSGYPDHAACIKRDEAKGLGLIVGDMTTEAEQLAWKIYRADKKKGELVHKKRQQEMLSRLKEIPSELLDALAGKPDGDVPENQMPEQEVQTV